MEGGGVEGYKYAVVGQILIPTLSSLPQAKFSSLVVWNIVGVFNYNHQVQM